MLLYCTIFAVNIHFYFVQFGVQENQLKSTQRLYIEKKVFSTVHIFRLLDSEIISQNASEIHRTSLSHKNAL